MGISQPFFTRPRPATSVSASNDSPRHPRAKMGSGNLRRLWKLVRRSVTTDRAFGPLRHLPQSFSGKGMARPRLEIAFEHSRFGLIGKRDIGDEAPRQKLGGMHRFAGVVLGKAALQVGGQADVALVGVAFALKEIDIEHLIPLGSPSFAKASEGILLRATALQGL